MVELDEIIRRLDGVDKQLSGMAKTLEIVAVQGERLANMQTQINVISKDVRALETKASAVELAQAKCPIVYINKSFWIVQGAIIVAIIGVGLKTFGVV